MRIRPVCSLWQHTLTWRLGGTTHCCAGMRRTRAAISTVNAAPTRCRAVTPPVQVAPGFAGLQRHIAVTIRCMAAQQ